MKLTSCNRFLAMVLAIVMALSVYSATLFTASASDTVVEGEILLGDVNADKKVDALDAARILKYSTGSMQLTEKELFVADVNGDGEVNSIDAAQILKYAAGSLTQPQFDISVKTEPTKKSYFVGDTLDTSGLTLTMEYNSGAAKTVTEGFSCTPATLNDVGTQTITVSYGGKSATFTVSVSEVQLASIAMKTEPAKTSYYVGDTLDTAGLTLTASYNNGTSETVTEGFSCTPTTLSDAGTQTITVSYGGKSTAFTVEVENHYFKGTAITVGSYVTFGSYEQDNNTSNGKEDIEWLVLDIQDGKALIISKYGLDAQQYNSAKTSVTWETCTLRTWLNDSFLNSAFSSSEIALIPTVTVSADTNLMYGTSSGNATQDKVFVLNFTEAKKYFSTNSERNCKATAYAEARGVYTLTSFSLSGYEGSCIWWLRTPGETLELVEGVALAGDINNYGYNVADTDTSVRPALWIELDS